MMNHRNRKHAARGPDSVGQIWKIDDKSKPPRQVTATEIGAHSPSQAPDGTWFVYTLGGGTTVGDLRSAGVWRQRIGGEDPVLLVANARQPVISPDGENVAVAVFRSDDNENLSAFFEVVPAKGGAPVYSVESENGEVELRWRPDGQAFTYLNLFDGEVWLQSMDPRPPEQLTHLGLGHGSTRSYSWSLDGQWLYLVREVVTTDAVLIRNF